MDTTKLITVFGNSSFFGFCNSNPSDQIKIVSCDDYRLAIGARITVLFSNSNLAEEPKLNVNNTGEKPILFKNQPISNTALAANYSYEFVYDGTSYHLLKAQSVTNTSEEPVDLGNGANPIGTIISFMGNTAPEGYLFCNGTIYEIGGDYTNLADFINTQFGSYNYFGGDGITTFAIPDLRGEFLRGTGKSNYSYTNGGSAVGTHQIPTRHKWIASDSSAIGATQVDGLYDADWTIKQGNWNYARNGTVSGSNWVSHYTSRPTNTSVMYCIKY